MRRCLPRGVFGWGLALFLLAFGLRMLDLFGRAKFDVWGQCEVERAAITLAQTGVMGDAFGPGTGPTAHVPPLYTVLLAGLHILFGVGSHEAVLAQRVLSAFMAAVVIALLPLVARRARLSPGVGNVAGLILAVSPVFFFVEHYGKQENVFSALLGMGLFLVWMRLREAGWQGRRDVWLFAFLSGLACLLAPQLLALVALALSCDFLRTFSRESPSGGESARRRLAAKRDVIRAGLAVAIMCAVMVAPWAWRNYHALGGFVPLRSNFGLEAKIGNNPVANGWTFAGSTTDSASTAWPHPYSNPREKARLKEIGELAYMREKSAEAKSWIADHPGDFVRLTLHRAWLFWFTPNWIWSSALSFVWLRVAFTAGLTLTAFIGLFLLFRRRHTERWPLLIVLVVPSLIYLVTHVNPRYRYINIWTTALLAGHTIVWAWAWLMSRRASLTPAYSTSVLPPRPVAWRAGHSHPESCESAASCIHDSAAPV